MNIAPDMTHTKILAWSTLQKEIIFGAHTTVYLIMLLSMTSSEEVELLESPYQTHTHTHTTDKNNEVQQYTQKLLAKPSMCVHGISKVW